MTSVVKYKMLSVIVDVRMNYFLDYCVRFSVVSGGVFGGLVNSGWVSGDKFCLQ